MEPSSLRLPAYRSSYLNRFHPYARDEPRLYDRLLQSDIAGDVEAVAEASDPAPPVVHWDETLPSTLKNLLEAIDESESLRNLDLALHPNVAVLPTRRIRLQLLIIDLAFAIVRERQGRPTHPTEDSLTTMHAEGDDAQK
ncbi:hypothetical protein IEO21_00294 [Rhodonia placenta]|uniref:Uncharacterized protein n=2 Tax=Rhodonia placenta TaxID=104341 RepID=A0A1X6NH44_9APHY|nr:hypothetical protein POSPLADRAFT_1038153 [Postia placenta MAD-698-R-SB12]KAF9821864.1 hypothetical protein IEO21_00294 [Postia placenta]OSX67746.1 hypothetical protein POSPLADRAFT_1038153 [Postia placenta MAD-698-R-SB12]